MCEFCFYLLPRSSMCDSNEYKTKTRRLMYSSAVVSSVLLPFSVDCLLVIIHLLFTYMLVLHVIGMPSLCDRFLHGIHVCVYASLRSCTPISVLYLNSINAYGRGRPQKEFLLFVLFCFVFLFASNRTGRVSEVWLSSWLFFYPS